MLALIRNALVVVGVAFGVHPFAAVDARAQTVCRLANIAPVRDPALAYQPRGNRCEGVYTVPVATSARLQLVGFHNGRFPSDVIDGTTRTLSVAITHRPAGERVLLQAMALRPLTFYAMDTTALSPDGSFTWDTGVLASPSLRLRANELGLLACTSLCDPMADPIYLPVGWQAPAGSEHGSYSIVLQAQRELAVLDYTLDIGTARLKAGNVPGPFPSRRAITIALGSLPDGVFLVRVSGRADDGSRSPLLLRIQVP